jgi:hypothetical protein
MRHRGRHIRRLRSLEKLHNGKLLQKVIPDSAIEIINNDLLKSSITRNGRKYTTIVSTAEQAADYFGQMHKLFEAKK